MVVGQLNIILSRPSFIIELRWQNYSFLWIINHQTDWHMSDPTSCLQMLQPNITSRMCWHLWSVLATADSSYRPALLAFSRRTWSSVVRAGEHFPARDSCWTRAATPVKGVIVVAGRQLVAHYSLRDLNPLSPAVQQAGNVPSEWGYEVSHHHISNRHFQGSAGSLNGLTAHPPSPLPPPLSLWKFPTVILPLTIFGGKFALVGLAGLRKHKSCDEKRGEEEREDFNLIKNISRLPLNQPHQLLL